MPTLKKSREKTNTFRPDEGSGYTLGTFSKRGRQRQRREARQILRSNPYILLSISLLWSALYVSIFAEIPLTPASPSERNDGR